MLTPRVIFHVDSEAKRKILQARVFAQVFYFLSYLFCFSLEHPVKKIKAACCVLRGVNIRNIVSLESFKSSLLRIYICSLSRVTSHGLKCVNKHPQVKKIAFVYLFYILAYMTSTTKGRGIGIENGMASYPRAKREKREESAELEGKVSNLISKTTASRIAGIWLS